MARTLRPDVVLMDVRMPHMDGIEATRHILAANPAVRILVLTTFDLDEYVYAAIRVGASGFLLKDIPPADLATAIRAVTAGDAVMAPQVTRRLINTFSSHLPNPTAPLVTTTAAASLSGRERDVVIEIARGQSNAEIAARLCLAEATVKSHISRILTKLELRDRVQIAVYAYEIGIVTPGTRDLA
jgi:DNA-binding NarL/FixJ family response regulator